MEYLSFEKPIEELIIKLDKAKALGEEDSVDVSKTVRDIEKKIDAARKNIYSNLSSWEKVQLSRHPQRPYSLDYIKALSNSYVARLQTLKNEHLKMKVSDSHLISYPIHATI